MIVYIVVYNGLFFLCFICRIKFSYDNNNDSNNNSNNNNSNNNNDATSVADLEKVWCGGCRCVSTKRARSACRPAEGRFFEGVPGMSPGKIV